MAIRLIIPMLFLVAAMQGLFLSFLLVQQRKGNAWANRSLSWIVLLFSISLIYYVLFWTSWEDYFHPLISLPLSFVWLFGPLVLVYVRQLSQADRLLIPFWHYLPFLFIISYRLPLLLVPNLSQSLSWLYNPRIQTFLIILQLGHLFTYFFLISRQITKTSVLYPGRSRWIVNIGRFYLGFIISYAAYYMLVWTGWLRIEYDYFISMMMAFFIYLVGYTGYLKPEIISSLPGMEKYSSSSLSKKTSKLLTEKVLQFMKEQKPFVNSELKLHDLATQLSLKPHQLSQIINENLHQNFSDFINQYRVNLAKSMLTQHDNGRIKLIEIAYDCGFNNKVSFNNAFKKMEGISPSAYLKKIQAFSN